MNQKEIVKKLKESAKMYKEKYQMVTYISKKMDINKVEKNIELCNKINIKILYKVVNLKWCLKIEKYYVKIQAMKLY